MPVPGRPNRRSFYTPVSLAPARAWQPAFRAPTWGHAARPLVPPPLLTRIAPCATPDLLCYIQIKHLQNTSETAETLATYV